MSFRVERLIALFGMPANNLSRLVFVENVLFSGLFPQCETRFSWVLTCVYLLRRPWRSILGGLPWGEYNMQKRLSGLLVAGLLLSGVLAAAGPLSAQTKREASSMPKVGDEAPDFTLKYFDGSNLKDVKLSDFRGKKNVVVAFYVFAFTGG